MSALNAFATLKGVEPIDINIVAPSGISFTVASPMSLLPNLFVPVRKSKGVLRYSAPSSIRPWRRTDLSLSQSLSMSRLIVCMDSYVKHSDCMIQMRN